MKPSSVSDGGKFRLLFTTSTARDATSSDIGVYNSFVQTRAKAGHSAISDACGDLFKAFASTSAVDGTDNANTESSDTAADIWWLGGAKVTYNYSRFNNGIWDSVAMTDESGAANNSQFVYTGSVSTGKRGTEPYPMGASTVYIARPNGFHAISVGRAVNTLSYPLYALSPVFTVVGAGCSTADADGSYEVPADWELKPSGLSGGETFRLLFVSSTERDGSSSDIGVYNSFVQTAAKAGLRRSATRAGTCSKPSPPPPLSTPARTPTPSRRTLRLRSIGWAHPGWPTTTRISGTGHGTATRSATKRAGPSTCPTWC